MCLANYVAKSGGRSPLASPSPTLASPIPDSRLHCGSPDAIPRVCHLERKNEAGKGFVLLDKARKILETGRLNVLEEM